MLTKPYLKPRCCDFSSKLALDCMPSTARASFTEISKLRTYSLTRTTRFVSEILVLLDKARWRMQLKFRVLPTAPKAIKIHFKLKTHPR